MTILWISIFIAAAYCVFWIGVSAVALIVIATCFRMVFRQNANFIRTRKS